MITSDLERKIDAEYLRLLKFFAEEEVLKDDIKIKDSRVMGDYTVRVITDKNVVIDIVFPDDIKKEFKNAASENMAKQMYGSPKSKDDLERIKRDGKLELLEQLTDYVLRQYEDFAKLRDGADNEHSKNMYYGCEHAFIVMTTRLRCETEGLLKEGA